MTTLLRNVLAGFGLLCASSFSAQAMPSPIALDVNTSASVIPVAQGCGVGGWRGPYGACHYGGPYRRGVYVAPHARAAYRCPPGYWRGPNGYCHTGGYGGYRGGYGAYGGYGRYRGGYGWR